MGRRHIQKSGEIAGDDCETLDAISSLSTATELAKSLAIDVDALDVEWATQAQQFIEETTTANEAAAAAKKELALAEEKAAQVKGEADREVRTYPEKYFNAKPTETSIAVAVTAFDTVVEANRRVIDLRYNVDRAISRAVSIGKAWDMRRDALSNLVRLATMGYFGTPSVPRNLAEEIERARTNRRTEAVARIRSQRSKRDE